MRVSSKPKVGTSASGVSQKKPLLSGIVECLRPNKPQASTHKKNSCEQNTPTLRLSETSGPGSTSTGKGFKPYWNDACMALQSQLWLPHTTGSVEPHSPSLSGSSNYMVGPSSVWKNQYLPKVSIPAPCLPSLPASVPVTTENGLVDASRKIRIYPENEQAFVDMLFLQRRAYNLAIERIKDKQYDTVAVRSEIRELLRIEYAERTFVSVVVDEAVNAAFATLKKCAALWKKGKKAELRFRSRKDTNQTFVVQRLSASGIFPQKLGACHITEQIPEEATHNMAYVTRRHGRWFVKVKYHVTPAPREIQAGAVVALDPGVRTFMTAYSPTQVSKYGEGFAAAEIFPLLRKRDSLLGHRQKLKNAKTDAQWWRDRFRAVHKRLDRISAMIEDRTDDLHRRVAHDLVTSFDTIIVPPFETSQMVAREGRKLRRSSVRQMQSLGHYQFQQTLRWACQKYGKTLVPCTEAYTSKTRSWDGVIINTLGGSTHIRDEYISVDRDINGARGIFLRAHTGQLSP